MSFWATTLPYTDPGQFKGGIRTRDAVLRNLQADAFRSASQNQVTDQAANARSGAAATNTRAATAQISQAATALNQKNIQLESHEQVLRTPLAYHVDNAGAAGAVITTSTDLNTLINSDATPGSNTANASSITSTALPGGDQANDAHLLVPGDDITITGTEYDGTAITTATFVYGAANNGTTVGDLIEFINGTGIGVGGGTDKFTTASMDLIGPGDEHNGKLRLVADNGGPGMLSIDIDAPDAHVTTAKDGSVTNRVTEIITGSTTGIVNDLETNAGISDGDTLSWTGTDSDGTPFASSFTVNTANVGFDGVNDLVAAINLNVPDASTVALSGGQLRFTAEDAGDVPLALTITNATAGGTPFGSFADTNTNGVTGVNAFSSFTLDHDTAATSVTTGTDLNSLDLIDDTNILNTGDEVRVTGTQKSGATIGANIEFIYGTNGTTVGDLINFLNGSGIGAGGGDDKFAAATVTLTSGDPGTLRVLEDSNSGAEPVTIDLNLQDEGKHIVFQDFVGPPSPDLLRLDVDTEQSEFLARGSANIAQDQGGNQAAYAELSTFDGEESTAFNSLTQNAQVTQTFDVDLTTTVLNCTLANNFGAFHGARFRELHSTDDNNAAQAIFTNGQRQGSAADSILQNAIASGGDADNTRTMTATFSQTGDVRHTGIIDMTRKETVALTPRGVDILARYAANSAQNTSASSQEQVQSQNGAAGINALADTTEDGGDAQNISTGNLVGTDAVTVANISSVVL
jgi:hypothetical protein